MHIRFSHATMFPAQSSYNIIYHNAPSIPIPGARNLRQIQSNYQSLDWSMSSEEMKFLSQAADGLAYVQPGVNPFPQKDKDTGLRMFDS